MELLERFAAGDLEAFEALFRQHQKEVYAWIVRIVRDSGIAEDLTVETFSRIYHARRETELPEDLPCVASEDSAVGGETRERIRQAFRELPAKYRLVATLALIEEEPYNNIAEAAGISATLVKVRVFRAVRMLRKKLNSLGVEVAAK